MRTRLLLLFFLLAEFCSAQNPEWISFYPWRTTKMVDDGDSIWLIGNYIARFDKATGNTRFIDHTNSPQQGAWGPGCVSGDGSVWITGSTGRDLRRLNSNGTWSQYTSADFGFTPTYMFDIISGSPGGNVCVGSTGNDGFQIYDGTNWTHFTSSNCPINTTSVGEINDLAYDNAGNLWVLGYTALYKFDGSNWTTINYPNSNYFNSWTNEHLYISPDNSVWVMNNASNGSDPAIAMYDGTGWTAYNSALIMTSSSADFPLSMTTDASGNLWMVTNAAKVWKFDGSGWTNYPGLTNYSSSHIGAMCSDAAGNVWYSSSNVVELNNSGFVHSWSPLSSAMIGPANHVAPHRNYAMVGMGKPYLQGMYGMAVLTDHWWMNNQYLNNNWYPGYVYALDFNDTNDVYYSCEMGIMHYSNGNFLSTTCPITGGNAAGVRVTHNGGVYIFRNSQIAFYDGSTWITYNSGNTGIPFSGVNEIIEDSVGNIWIADNSGLVEFNGTTWQITAVPFGKVKDLAIDGQGGIVMGCDSDYIVSTQLPGTYLEYGRRKLVRYFQSAFTVVQTERYSYQVSYFSPRYVNVEADNAGNVFYSLRDSGLSVWNIPNNSNTLLLSASSALSYDVISDIEVDENGNAWICTGELNVFRPGGILFTSNEPAVQPQTGLYPNPATNSVILGGLDPLQSYTVNIIDARGRRVKTQFLAAGENQVDVTSLLSGVYFVEIANDEQRRIEKLVVNTHR